MSGPPPGQGPPLMPLGSDPSKLRFKVGSHVVCNMNGQAVPGEVVALLHRVEQMPPGKCAAYVVRLITGQIIMPPIDHPAIINPLPEGQEVAWGKPPAGEEARMKAAQAQAQAQAQAASKQQQPGAAAAKPNLMKLSDKTEEEMRFKAGQKVVCNMGQAFEPGTVLRVKAVQPGMPEGFCSAYEVKLKRNGQVIYAPFDVEQLIREAPPLMKRSTPPGDLRFAVGDAVRCNVNGEMIPGIVREILPHNPVMMDEDECGAYVGSNLFSLLFQLRL